MRGRFKTVHPALKHGGYSTTTLLPGEDPAAFKKLHQDVIGEFEPNGPLEEDIVATIARLLWRKKNLETFRIAERARKRWAAIEGEVPPSLVFEDMPFLGNPIKTDPAVRAAALKAAKDQARAELGSAYDFVEMGETVTVEQLMKDLAVEEQLDAMIERCIKRLLLLRGLKSLSTDAASGPSRRLSAPSKAA